MADLLTGGDWTEIRGALQDVMDTFFKLPVTFVSRRQRKLVAFHENRKDDLEETTFEMMALLVPNNKDESKSQVTQEPKGFIDTSQGYLYFNYKWLKDNNFLLDDGLPNMIPNKDSFRFMGVEVSIIGVNVVGPTEADFQLVKVQYKNILIKENDFTTITNP